MFEVKNLKAGYDGVPVVHNVSFKVDKGQIVAILGSNGSGKTTCLRAITGGVKVSSGEIICEGKSIANLPSYKMLQHGIAMVPEGRQLFGKMSIQDNLLMGAYLIKDTKKIKNKLEEMYTIFPRLKERFKQQAETLSGGEQQMVAIARGLMSDPRYLILDEPSLGLSPLLVAELFKLVKEINKKHGVTIIIVEQNAIETLALSDYAYVIQNGETVIEGTGKELLNNEQVKKAYLGL